MTDEHGFDDGLVHGHSWATEPAIAPAQHGRKGPPDAEAIPTPSTAFHDDHMQG
ncbi:hypothetical protein [Teichococcus coralli]|uniref:hypothetical protein n=1 Tax=Teichococcus coralli TaxID=2545983 RepID=UPI00136A337E|nr:hypothetical protein [Pseudoroseomonas coralli]